MGNYSNYFNRQHITSVAAVPISGPSVSRILNCSDFCRKHPNNTEWFDYMKYRKKSVSKTKKKHVMKQLYHRRNQQKKTHFVVTKFFSKHLDFSRRQWKPYNSRIAANVTVTSSDAVIYMLHARKHWAIFDKIFKSTSITTACSLISCNTTCGYYRPNTDNKML